jgi:large subunit ribosomal protein L18e
MASFPETKTTNQELFDTIRELKKYANANKSSVWRAVASRLAGAASQRAEVNLNRISKNTKEGETIIVPGKVLGDGLLNKKVTIVAYSATESAKQKISKGGGKFVTIREHLASKPKDKPKIIG